MVAPQQVAPGAAVQYVVAVVAEEKVVARAAVKLVVAVAPVQDVVAGVANELVVAFLAEKPIVPGSADEKILSTRTLQLEVETPPPFFFDMAPSPGLPLRDCQIMPIVQRGGSTFLVCAIHPEMGIVLLTFGSMEQR